MDQDSEHRTTCLLADDHPAILRALVGLLPSRGFEVVGATLDGSEVAGLARSTRPAVAVLDYGMPHLGGAALISAVLEASPETAVVVYTADADARTVAEMLSAGARGIVLKEGPIEDLTRALAATAGGKPYIDPALAQIAIRGSKADRTALTPREAEVLRLIAAGSSHQEAADELGISLETVRTHLANARRRLGARTRTHTVATAIREKLIA